MAGEAEFGAQVDRALNSAKARMDGLTTSGQGTSFTLRYRVPNGAESDSRTKMRKRFSQETGAVSDIMDAYGLPKLNDEQSWDTEDETDGSTYTRTYTLNRPVASDDLNFGPDPNDGILDTRVNFREAGDDTPPVGEDDFTQITTDDIMETNAYEMDEGEDYAVDLLQDSVGDRTGKMESLRDVVGDYKERRAVNRAAGRASRQRSRQLVSGASGAVVQSSAPRGRHGRGKLKY